MNLENIDNKILVKYLEQIITGSVNIKISKPPKVMSGGEIRMLYYNNGFEYFHELNKKDFLSFSRKYKIKRILKRIRK